jgi:hypothetical protein
LPAGIDTHTALIAAIKPRPLRTAVYEAIVRNYRLELRGSDTRLAHLEAEFERILEKPSTLAERRAARRALEDGLMTQQYAQEFHAEIEPEARLAYETDKKVLTLSKPARWAATLACALAFGGGVTATGYQAAHESNIRAREIANEHNRTASPENTIEVPTLELNNEQRVAVYGLGALMTAGGGIVGSLVGLQMAGRIAHGRANRMIRKAATSD